MRSREPMPNESKDMALEYYVKLPGYKPDTILVDLWYPRNEGMRDKIEIGLMDVRASDGIRVSYDFDRDGWIIEQGSVWAWGPEEKTDCDWQEVAFLKSWAREGKTDV